MFNQSLLRKCFILCSVLSGFLFGIVFFKYQLTVHQLYHNLHPYSERFKSQSIQFDSTPLRSRERYDEWLRKNHFKQYPISPEEKSFSPDRLKLMTEAKFLKNTIKVHCLILTRSREQSRTVLDTWSKNCNSVSFYAKFNDHKNPHLTHLYVGDESIYSARTFCQLFIDLMSKNYQFDWLLITIDGTFAIVDNLRFHVATLNSSVPYYLGRPVKHFLQNIYNAYDSGIVLSRGAVRKLRRDTFPDQATCRQRLNSSALIPTAGFDAFIGNELHRGSVYPVYTLDRDATLFHPFTPAKHIHPNLIQTMDSYWNSQVFPTFIGLGACSDRAITFGTFSPVNIRFVDYLLYHVSLFKEQYSGIGNNLPPSEAYKVPSDIDKIKKN